jgi:hypothetical protein
LYIVFSIPKGERIKHYTSPGTMAHTYNTNYSGGRHQVNNVSKPAQANSSQEPISKIPKAKKGWRHDSNSRVPA